MTRAVTGEPGVTSPLAAAMAGGPTDAIPRGGGAHVTPSVLAFTPGGHTPLAGEVARRRAIVHTEPPEATAGVSSLQIVDGPCPAAIAYGVDRTGQETLLVFDLGGSFELPLLGVGEALRRLYQAAEFDLRHGLATPPGRQAHRHAQELLIAHPADAEAVVRRTHSAALRRED
jgi:molecular chaperone DnaK (HSP70)